MNYELNLLVQKLNSWSTSSILATGCRVTLAKAADVIKEQDEKITELEQKNIQLIKEYNELVHRKEGVSETLLCHLLEE